MDILSYRAEYPITERYAVLNHAGISPVCDRIAAALREHIEQMQTIPLQHLYEKLMALGARLQERATLLINASRADEIAFMGSTAAGINTAAASLPLRAGDNVLVLEGDYPANVYPWLNLAPRGILVKWVPRTEGGLDLERLAARIDRRTRVIALSTVMFSSGFRNDLAAVGRMCRERGIYFVVDGIQSLGAFPLDVQAWGIDVLACGGQKWLLGVPGSGFMYCRHELLDELELGAYVGASSVVDAANFLDYNFTLQPTSARFNLGAPNFLGMVALDCALGLLLEVGVERIAERILALTDRLIEDLQGRGYAILSNLQREHRSGIVIVAVPEPEAANERLLAAGVLTTVRGGGIRVAPHFYNNEEDVLRVGEVLATAGTPS